MKKQLLLYVFLWAISTLSIAQTITNLTTTPSGNTYTISFTIVGGVPPYSSGGVPAITGNTFSYVYPCNFAYDITISDAVGGSDQVTGASPTGCSAAINANWCNTATPVSCDAIINGTTIGETNDLSYYWFPTCLPNNSAIHTGPDRIYRLVKTDNSTLSVGMQITTPNTDLDLFLLDATCNSVLACQDIGGTNNAANNLEGVIAPDLPAGTYYIVVDSNQPNIQGNFVLDITCGDLNCSNIQPILCGVTYEGNSALYGENGSSIYLCGGNSQNVNNSGPEVIYSFTTDQSGIIDVQLSNLTNNLELFLLQDACDVQSCIGQSFNIGTLNEQITTSAPAGTYYVVVDGFNAASGTFDLLVTANCTPPPTPSCPNNPLDWAWLQNLINQTNCSPTCQLTVTQYLWQGQNVVDVFFDGECFGYAPPTNPTASTFNIDQQSGAVYYTNENLDVQFVTQPMSIGVGEPNNNHTVFDCEGNLLFPWGGGANDNLVQQLENPTVVWQCASTLDCPALQANIGSPCNDNNPNTTNDVITATCICQGTPSTPCQGGEQWTTYNTANSGLPNNTVLAIAIDASGNKWIGTNGGGVGKFDGTTWTTYNTANSGLPNNTVWAIAIDANGNKWIGTEGGGLAKFDGTAWTTYNTSNSGLPNNIVLAIVLDANGNKWIGTFEGGLAKFDGTTWTTYNTANSGLPNNTVWAIAIDANGNKWIGTYGGVTKFDGTTWTTYNTANSGLPVNSVFAIAIDANGKKWIGTNGGGLAKFDGTNWTTYNTNNSGLPNNRVWTIAIDANGSKWMGTNDGGLAKFDDTTWTTYNIANSGLPANIVNTIALDVSGNKWIGTMVAVGVLSGNVANCPCPILTSPIAQTQTVCAGTSPNFAQAQSTLQYTDEFVQLDSIIWSTNAAFTNRINLATYTATYIGNICQATDTLYCALICKNTTAAPIGAGYLALQINPSTYNNALVSTSTLPCQVPTITSTCITYTITPISVPTTVNAGDSGTATWQVTNGCFIENINLPYSCSITVDCPALQANIGSPCNDNNPNTTSDVITATCICQGTPSNSCNLSCTPNGNNVIYACLSDAAANTSFSIGGGTAPYRVLGSGIYNAVTGSPFDFGVDPLGLTVPAGTFQFQVQEGQPWTVIVQDAVGCIVVQTGVFDLPNPMFNTPATMCTSDPTINIFENSIFDPAGDILNGQFFFSAAGGVDNGDGFSATFDPFIAGPGQHFISYCVSAEGGDGPGFGSGNYQNNCTICYEQTIYVYPAFDGYDGAGNLVTEIGLNTGGSPEADAALQTSVCVGHPDMSLGLTNFDDIDALFASLEDDFDPNGQINEVDFFITWAGNGITDNADGTATFSPAALGPVPPAGIATSIQVTVGYPSCPTVYVVVMNVTDNPPINVTVNSQTICLGQSTSITASASSGIPSPSYNYIWSTGAVTQSISSSPAATTTYTVTVSDICGNSATASGTVTVQNAPVPIITAPNYTCATGGTVALSANVGGGTWSGPGVNPITGVFNPATALALGGGIVTITYTVTGVCVTSDTHTITIIDLNAIINTTQPTCGLNNGSLTVVAAGDYDYQWSTGSINATINNQPAGTYSVTVTTIGGCATVASATLTQANIGSPCNDNNPNTINDIIQSDCTCTGTLIQSSILDITQQGLGGSAQNFLLNNFIEGSCGTISNASYTGSTQSVGLFTYGAFEGIILSTGNVNNAEGTPGGFASTNMGTAGNAELTNIAGSPTYDAAILQFDFIPTSNTVSFNYRFASEEYPEWVNSSFNDLFAFGISGPGIAGTQNIALVPGTSQAVSIDNVNQNANNQYYNANLPGQVYDGSTDVFTATATVTPCQTYQLTIAIADAGDSGYDSALFLEAQSFNTESGAVVSVIGSTLASSNTTYEDCAVGYFRFERESGTDINVPVTISYTVGGTANPTTDYNGPIPTTITIPGGQQYVQIPIIAYADAIAEGTETISIQLIGNGCTCPVVMNITDNPPINVTVNSQTLCPGQAVSITASASGGIPFPSYNYIWNTGSVTQSISGSPAATTTYTVTVSDICGNSATASGTVTVQSSAPVPIITAPNFTCAAGGTVALSANVGGGTWSGPGVNPTTGVFNPAAALASGGGIVTITYTVAGVCGTGSDTHTITIINLSATINPTQPTCANNGNNGSLTVVPAGGANYTYQWSTGGINATINNQPAGTYSVTVTSVGGCATVASATLTAPQPPSLSINIVQSPTCQGTGNNGQVSASAVGGTPNYSFIWSAGNVTTPAVNNVPPGTYTLTVSDANNCTASASVTLLAAVPPTVSIDVVNLPCASANNGTLTAAPIGGLQPYSYNWSNSQTTQTINGLSTGTYTVTVTAADGCSATASTSIPVVVPPSVGTLVVFNDSDEFTPIAVTNPANGTATINPDNTITYTPDAGFTGTDVFVYQAVNANGSTVLSTVTVLVQTSSACALNTNWTIDCSTVPSTGNYQVNLFIQGGVAPYSVTGTYNQSNITDGNVSFSVQNGVGFVIIVTDSDGNQFAIDESEIVPCGIDYTSCLQEAQPTIEWQKSLGGSNNDYGYSAKQTPDGGYIVAGTAASTNFNVTGNHGGNDYWVVKLNAAGSIVWQKTYGGTDDDEAKDIQLTPDGGYIVAGNTYSTNGDITLNNGQNDYWVVKLDSNGNIVWQKTLGGESYDYAESITLTNDGGYAIAGYSFSVGGDVTGNNGFFDYWIVKLDSNGNLVWQNALGGTDVEEAYSIRLTADNGFIVAGSTYSPNSGNVTGNHGTNTRDYWIVKLNANGSLVWQKALGGTISDAAYDVQQTTDGGYIVAGYALSNNGDVTNNHGSLDYWIVKLDSNGTLIWQKALGGSSSDWAYSIAQTTDGGFVVTGYTSSNNGDVTGNNGAFDYSTMKLDANGNLVWQKSLGSTDDDTAFDVLQTTDGGYLLTGSAGANGGNVTGNHGFNDYWIVKLAAPELVTPICEAQTSVPVIANNAPYCTDSTLYVSAANYNTDFCYGQTYLLCTATPDSSILAQNTTGIFNLADLGITAGNYVVVALNYFHATLQADTLSSLNQLATLCANYQSISITVQACTPCSNPLTPNITGNTTICQGSSTTLNAGAGYATYLWNNGATTQTINALTFGNYAVVVTDANGCTGNTQVSVTIASSIIVNATSTNGSCGGNNGTATVTANGSSNYTYLWSNSQTTQTINNLSAGTYTVTVTSGICNATASVILVTPPPVNASATSTNPLCNGGANGTVSVTASGGTPAYTYAWSNGQNSANANGLASGSYTVTVTDSQGCSTTTNVTLTQPTPVTASATGTNPLCNGATNGSATVTASGGTPAGYTYAWSNGQTAITATNLAAGTYTVTVTDSQGCSKTTTVTVIQPTNLTASATGVNPSCNGDTSGSAVATASGGTPPLTYLWNNGQATAAATNLAAGNYWVTVTDGNGCTATASVVISSNNITPTITGNTTICGGNSTTLTASGGGTGATYNWSNIAGANNPVNNIVSPTTNTTYTVTVTNTNGCTGIASATINVQAAPIVSLTTTDTTLCTASTINLSALLSNNSNTNGSWVGTGVFGNLFDASQVTAGTYQILYIVMPSGACGMVSDTLYIHVGTPLTPNITGSLSFCQGSSTTLNAGAGYAGYIWSNTTTNQTITVNNAGTYTVTVSSVNGCTATASTTVTVNANPNPSISGSSTFCTGTSTTLTANGGGTYAWTASNGGVISGAANTASITVNTTGTYTVVVTNNGCTGTASIAVSEAAALAPNITGNTQICPSTTTSLNAGSFSSYLWSASAGNAVTQSVNNIGVGTYSVTVSDASGCTGTASTNVIQLNPTATASNNGPICAGNNVSLSASVGTTYNWSGTGITASTQNQQNPVIAGATVGMSGNYVVTVTDANGCTATASTTVTVNDCGCAITLAYQTINPTCNGANDGNITLTPTGGSGVYVYTWFPSISTSNVANDVGAGTYLISVADANDAACTASQLVVVNNGTGLTASINPIVSCDSNNLDLSVNGVGSYTYTWSGGLPNIQDPSNVAAGTYTVTVSNISGGCSATASASITQPIPITVDITGNTAICSGASTSLDAGSGFAAYTWNTGSITQNITVNAAGTYTVTVTNVNGCTGTDAVSITTSPNPTPNITGNTAICSGNSTSLDAGSGFAAYAWNTGSITQNITVNAAGTYTVTVTNANGCTGTDAVIITTSPNPTPNITGNTAICSGNSTSLDAGSGFVAYTWNTGSIAQNITVNAAGTYTVTVTNANGCTGTDAVIITTSPNPTPDITGNTAICSGNSTSLDAGSGFAAYTWNTGSITQNITVNAAGTYTVTVTNVNGCTGTDAVSITTSPNPTPNITGNTAICSGNSTSLDAGSGFAAYAWNTGSITQNITVNAAGTYTVTVTNANGCTGTDAVIITTSPNPTPNITGNTAICSGNSTSLDAGSGFAAYTWNTGSIAQNITVNAAGTYAVTVTTANGCTGTDAVIITTSPNPTPNITGNTAICSGNSTSLDAGSGFAAYTWNTGSITQNITVNAAGTYTVTVTTAAGCTGTDDAIITTSPNPTPQITGNTAICSGASTNLDAGSGFAAYAWNTGSIAQNITVNAAGTYTVTVTNANGCTGTDDVIITTSSNPTPNITGNTAICSGNSTSLDAGSDFATYAWNTGSITQNITVNTAGTYTVTVTNANGCTGTDALILTVQEVPIIGFNTSDTTICSAAMLNLSDLLTDNSFNTGTWVGTGVFGNVFDANQVASGTYEVLYVIMPNGACGMFADTLLITVANTPLSPIITGNLSVCEGSATILDASNTEYVQYVWSSGETTPNITTTAAGDYTVTVTNTNGCTGSAVVSVTVNTTVPNAVTTTPNVCEGTTIELQGSGGVAYSWTGPNGFSSLEQNPSIASSTLANQGAYTLVVIDSIGCTSQEASVVVTVQAAPIINLSLAVNSLCSNDVFSLSDLLLPNSTQGGVWVGEAVFGDLFFAEQVTAGNHTVSYVIPADTSGVCPMFIGEANLTVVPAIEDYNKYCIPTDAGYQVSFNLMGGTAPYSINGVAVVAGETYVSNVFTNETYSLLVIDANGCSTFVIGDNDNCNADCATVSTGIITAGDDACSFSVFLTNAPPPIAGQAYAFSIDGTTWQNTDVFTDLAAGTYNVYVQHSCGTSIIGSYTAPETCEPVGIAAINELLVKIYPNPTSGIINIESAKATHATIIVYNAIGQIVTQRNTHFAQKETLDLSNNPAGVYLVTIKTANDYVVKKIVLN